MSKPALTPLAIAPKARAILPKYESGSDPSSPSMDHTQKNGEPAAKRRCISSACMPCRKRKSKCDGASPICTACKTVYNSECFYDLDADNRRKGALKRNIAELKADRENLEDELRKKSNLLSTLLGAIRSGTEADVDDLVHLIRSSPEENVEHITDSIQALTTMKHHEPMVENSSRLEGELSLEPSRKHSTDANGTHYGHTSHLSLQEVEEDSSATAFDQVGAWTTVSSDSELIDHLLDRYFTWCHPLYLLFSEETFTHGRQAKKAKYCTPLLVNAILALACNYSDHPEVLANPPGLGTMGNRFFAEAVRLLSIDDGRPSVTKVQALAVMSLRQVMNGNDSSGRNYSAQMMSMTVELGLHLSNSGQAKLTESEIEARRVSFWGIFNLEILWSVCIGRLPTLPRAAIRLEKPKPVESMDRKLWQPHGMPIDGAFQKMTQYSYRYTLQLQHSLLFEIVSEIMLAFYAPRDRITSRMLQKFHQRLQDWYRNLPGGLAIRENGPTLPQFIVLHIFYHNCIIQLFRPFLRVAMIQSSKPPRQICTESANTISRLVDLYSQTYSLKRSLLVMTHCVMSSAVIHLVDVSRPHPADPQSEIYLANSIRNLNEMQQSSIITSRFTIIFVNLIFKWCKPIRPIIKQAMDDVNINSPSSTRTSISSSVSPRNPGFPHPFNRHGSNASMVSESDSNYIHHGRGRQPSAPEILQMAPQYDLNGTFQNTNNSRQCLPFWSPYGDNEGVPLNLEQTSTHVDRNMDIANILQDSEIDDWAALNRDGFYMMRQDGAWSFDYEGDAQGRGSGLQ